MKKMLSLFGVGAFLWSGAGVVTANSVNQQINSNTDIQRDKEYLIEYEILEKNTIGVAKLAYKTAKINLTALGINNLNDLKNYQAVSLPDFTLRVDGHQINNANYFLAKILITDLKIVTHEDELIASDNKIDFREFINNKWYLGKIWRAGAIWTEHHIITGNFYLKIFYTFEIQEEALANNIKQINLSLESGSLLKVLSK